MALFSSRNLSRALAGAALLGASVSASAVPVDLQLSLVIDVSGSVSASEYNLQMDGYANAFRDAEVQQNLLAGANGAAAVNVVFFAGNFFTRLNSFEILDSAASITAFANTLDTVSRPGSGSTDIYDGVNRALDLLLAAGNGITATRQVIDVSGDGTDSITANRAARNRAAAAGITVNGLAIESSASSTTITNFYTDNVITPDGFVETSANFADFEAAVLRKVRTETVIAAVPTPATLSLVAFAGLMAGAARRARRS